MPWERFTRLLDECLAHDEFTELILDLQNEPLLDRELSRRVSYVKSASEGRVFVGITTNARALTRDVSASLIDAGIDRIVVSLNAARASTYARIAPAPSFEAVVANVQGLLEVDGGPDVVELSFGCSRDNVDDLDPFVEHAEAQRLRYRVFPLHDRLGSVANEAFLELPAERTCHLPLFSVAVLLTGDVILCCQDWRSELVLGNVFETSLEEVWNSERYLAVRRGVAGDGQPAASPCSGCDAPYVYTATPANPRELQRIDRMRADTFPGEPADRDRWVVTRHGSSDAVYDFALDRYTLVSQSQAQLMRGLLARHPQDDLEHTVYGGAADAAERLERDLDQLGAWGLLEPEPGDLAAVVGLPRKAQARLVTGVSGAQLTSIEPGARRCVVALADEIAGVTVGDRVELSVPSVIETFSVTVRTTLASVSGDRLTCDVDDDDSARWWKVLGHEAAGNPLAPRLLGAALPR